MVFNSGSQHVVLAGLDLATDQAGHIPATILPPEYSLTGTTKLKIGSHQQDGCTEKSLLPSLMINLSTKPTWSTVVGFLAVSGLTAAGCPDLFSPPPTLSACLFLFLSFSELTF